jgi:hypothetical protein
MICGMRMLLGVVMLFGACVVEHHQGPNIEPTTPVQPRTCTTDTTLDGSTGAATPTKIGPVALDQNGISVCLHLDATHNLVAAHFSATTDRESGATTSSFATTLEDASFARLVDGWDVTFGSAPPVTFENLEWNAPLHATTDAVLWVRAPSGGTTTVEVALFEPFE